MGNVLTGDQVRQVRAFALKKYAANDFNHNTTHMRLTVDWARYLARQERADEQVCVVAAYLHDIARSDKGHPSRSDGLVPRLCAGHKHGPQGAKAARVFLKSIKVPDDFIGKVCYAIATHDSGSPKRFLEAEILWDADKLQSVGPYGYVRILGHHLHYDTKDVLRAHALTVARHRFFYKRFYTRTGKRIARLLHGYTEEFCRLLDAVKIPRPYELQKTA